MSEKETLLADLNAEWHLMESSRQLGDWDSLQAMAEKVRNTARKLDLLKIQEQSELRGKIV